MPSSEREQQSQDKIWWRRFHCLLNRLLLQLAHGFA